MTEAEKIVEQLSGNLSNVKNGSLRIWVQWFGRPMDNWHSLVACEAEGNTLLLKFNEDETLCVWAPRQAVINDKIFRIKDADRVRWEWFSYGRPKTPSNRYFEDFIKKESEIIATTNVDWYTPNLCPTSGSPAVEIL
jgi:hypothetical protein